MNLARELYDVCIPTSTFSLTDKETCELTARQLPPYHSPRSDSIVFELMKLGFLIGNLSYFSQNF